MEMLRPSDGREAPDSCHCFKSCNPAHPQQTQRALDIDSARVTGFRTKVDPVANMLAGVGLAVPSTE